MSGLQVRWFRLNEVEQRKKQNFMQNFVFYQNFFRRNGSHLSYSLQKHLPILKNINSICLSDFLILPLKSPRCFLSSWLTKLRLSFFMKSFQLQAKSAIMAVFKMIFRLALKPYPSRVIRFSSTKNGFIKPSIPSGA